VVVTVSPTSDIGIEISDDYIDDFHGFAQPERISYKPVYGDQKRGQDISIAYPVENRWELDHVRHIESMVSEDNRKRLAKTTPNTVAGDDVFDAAIIQMAERACRAEGAPIEDCSTDRKKIIMFTIRELRNMSWSKFANYINESDIISRKHGYNIVSDGSTLYRWAADCGYCPTIIADVSTRLAHAAYRCGIDLPASVREKYNLYPLEECNFDTISSETKMIALINWTEYILSRVFNNISFGRGENKSLSVEEIIAGFAMAVFYGLNGATRCAKWHWAPDDIPSASRLRSIGREMSRDTIRDTFEGVYDNFVSAASQLGFFDRALAFAVDTTWIDVGMFEENIPEAIENPEECENDEGLCFVVIHSIGPGENFTLGLDLVTSKSEIEGACRRLLLKRKTIDRDCILADRGFYSGDAVRMCRHICDDNWIIRAKNLDKGEISKKFSEVDEEENLPPSDVHFGETSPNPNLAIYYVPEKANHWPAGTHMGFLTDLTQDEIDAEELFHRYRHRWRIEQYLDTIKHDIAISTQSTSANLYFFLLEIQTLFYNIYHLVNNSRSPKLGLPLEVEYDQVLLAISDAVYDRRDCPWR
jgi:hypothetical protein